MHAHVHAYAGIPVIIVRIITITNKATIITVVKKNITNRVDRAITAPRMEKVVIFDKKDTVLCNR